MPSLPARIQAGIKAALPYPKGNGGGLWGFASGFLYGYPRFDNLTDPWPRGGACGRNGETFDALASAGNPHDNGVVAICLGKIANCFAEPALQVIERQADGTWEPVEDHPLLDLMAYPNPWDDLSSLGTAWSASYKVDGNAYLVLSRSRGGGIKKIDFVFPDQMQPVGNSEELITHYLYRVDGKEIPFPAEDVLHWRYGKDPGNPRLGCSKLKKLIYELASDNEAGQYTAAILHNLGIVGGVLSYTGDPPGPTPEDSDKIKARWRENTTGANRGGLLVPTFPSKYEDVGRSPEEMALDIIRQIPTARLCAALDVNAGYAGLAESTSYANKAEGREEFWDDCMIPLGTRFTDGLTRYLLPLFGEEIRGPRRRRVRFCYDEVRALQPDLDKISTRKVREWQSDLVTLNEAREAVGEKALEDSDPRGKLFFSELTGEMKQKFTPPQLQLGMPGQVGQNGDGKPASPNQPESNGDRAANERTPPFAAEAGLNGKA